MLGKVLNYNKARGYGFIRSFENGKDYFCHVSQIDDGVLYKGYIVHFNARYDEEKDRPYAIKIQVVEGL